MAGKKMTMDKNEWLLQLTLQELKSQVAEVLAIPSATVSSETPIVQLGFGIQSLLRLVQNLNQQLGFALQPQQLFEYPTLSMLSQYVLSQYSAQILAKLSQLDSAVVPMQPAPYLQSQPSQSAAKPVLSAALSGQELKQKLTATVLQSVSTILSMPVSELTAESEIIDLGFNSLSLTKFAENLSSQLAISIHLGIFFEYTSLSALVDYLLEQHGAAVASYYGSPVQGEEPAKQPVNKPINGFDPTPMPVIIGAGITGMCISRALSQQKIAHVMIGDPMINDTPRLGESMNEMASIDLIQEYPEFSQYFFDKQEISFYAKDTVALLNLRGKKGHTFYDAYEQLGFNPQTEYANMVHIDRLGFDRALHQQVIQSPYCKIIPGLKVSKVDYDEASETISRVHLENGQQIQSSYVFDATNHIRLLGRLLNIDANVIDDPRYVFFSHFHRRQADKSTPLCHIDTPWLHATNIVRLHQELDGVEGVAWCIPAGDYISVGVSVDAADGKQADREEMMELLYRAYQRRGLDYLELFPERKEIVVVPGTRHFSHPKVFGKNWLMAGGAAAQFWFPSSSNLSISLMAAKIAPKIIQGDAAQWLEVYRQVNVNLEKIHWIYDRWITGQCDSLTELGLFAKNIYSTGNKRMALYAMVRNGEAYFEVAKQMSQTDIPKYAMMSQEVRVMKEPELTQQTQRLADARASLMAYIDKQAAKSAPPHEQQQPQIPQNQPEAVVIEVV